MNWLQTTTPEDDWSRHAPFAPEPWQRVDPGSRLPARLALAGWLGAATALLLGMSLAAPATPRPPAAEDPLLGRWEISPPPAATDADERLVGLDFHPDGTCWLWTQRGATGQPRTRRALVLLRGHAGRDAVLAVPGDRESLFVRCSPDGELCVEGSPGRKTAAPRGGSPTARFRRPTASALAAAARSDR